MASYWIVAAAVVCTAWPSSSKAYVVCQEESRAGSPAEHTVPPTDWSSSSSASNASAKARVAPETTKPAGVAPVAVGAVPAPAAQSRDSFLLIELSQTLKAKKLKPGDRIKAAVSQDVVERGRIVIPAEARVVGHVTEVAVRDQGNPESRLGVVFDKILVKGHGEIDIEAVVQAVAPPVLRRSRVDEPSQMSPSLFDNPRQSAPGRSGRSRSGPTVPTDAMNSSSPLPAIYRVPFAGGQSGETNSMNASSVIRSQTAAGQSLSVGTPLGVTGLKGIGLTPGATASTPGPVLVSNRDNVKLEDGTQILLRVTSARMAHTQ